MLRLNLQGFNCPIPVLKTKKFLSNVPSGAEIEVTTTDPASLADLKIFCEKTENVLISQSTENDIITTIIRKK